MRHISSTSVAFAMSLMLLGCIPAYYVQNLSYLDDDKYDALPKNTPVEVHFVKAEEEVDQLAVKYDYELVVRFSVTPGTKSDVIEEAKKEARKYGCDAIAYFEERRERGGIFGGMILWANVWGFKSK